MNNIGHIENNFQSYRKNKTGIKPIRKSQDIDTFKNHLKDNKKVCSCFGLIKKDLDEYKNFDELKEKTGASTRCTSCLIDLQKHYLQLEA